MFRACSPTSSWRFQSSLLPIEYQVKDFIFGCSDRSAIQSAQHPAPKFGPPPIGLTVFGGDEANAQARKIHRLLTTSVGVRHN
jgi:hypothetical protein